MGHNHSAEKEDDQGKEEKGKHQRGEKKASVNVERNKGCKKKWDMIILRKKRTNRRRRGTTVVVERSSL